MYVTRAADRWFASNRRADKKGEALKEREKKKSKKQEAQPQSKDSKWLVNGTEIESGQKNNNNKMEDNGEIADTMDTNNSITNKPTTTNPELKDLFALKFKYGCDQIQKWSTSILFDN